MVTHYKEIAELGGTGYPVGADMEGVMNTVNQMYKILIEHIGKENKKHHWTLVCRGSSGAILAGAVGCLLKSDKISCEILHIKKPGEQSHQESATFQPKSKIIIIDDFIVSGNTVNSIHRELVEIGRPFEVDILIVGETFSARYLDFKPNYIYCRGLNLSLHSENKFIKI